MLMRSYAVGPHWHALTTPLQARRHENLAAAKTRGEKMFHRIRANIPHDGVVPNIPQRASG
jgi:hypothetical protein